MTAWLHQWLWLIIMMSGFMCGVYVSSARIRHFVNALAIIILKRTDSYYREPEPEIIIRERVREKIIEKPVPSFTKDYSKRGIPVSQEEVEAWLKKNPDIKVGEKP